MRDLVMAIKGPVLVLGAGGFVGSNLVAMLSKYRTDVIGTIAPNGASRLSPGIAISLRELDITDLVQARALLDEVKPGTIFDTIAYGAYSFEKDAEKTYQTNFLAKVKVLEVLEEVGRPTYIHAGSSSEYGLNCSGPSEDAELVPNSPYAVSKVAIAAHLRFLGSIRRYPCLNLRLYSVYGPLEDTSRLMPTLIKSALTGKLPPLVHQDISRDFVYIDDVCRAFVKSAVKLDPSFYGESINIGSGRETRIEELAKLASEIFGISEVPVFGSMPNRAWDTTRWYSNSDRASRRLEWKAETTMVDGIHMMTEWVRSVEPGNWTKGTKQNRVPPKRSMSAIIACYKDEPAIPVMYQRLSTTFAELGVDYEIIFINDGSPDQSEAAIAELSSQDRRVVGITHSRNFGSQMAFRSGMEVATKECVILLDGDLQDPPELIRDFYTQWCKGFDVVYGRRVKRDMPYFWSVLYKGFYRVLSATSYVSIPLDAGDFSLIDRRVVRWLLACPERDLFLRGLRAYVGFRQCGVDYIRPKRMFGESTNNLFKNIEWAKLGIFSFSDAPLRLVTWCGLGIFLLSLITALAALTIKLISPATVASGATTITIIVCLLGGANLLGLGIIGEYVGKTLVETKRRPRLIRRSIIRGGNATPLDFLDEAKNGQS
jgi:polyisoprenyl-phosphate glycosyltransferase